MDRTGSSASNSMFSKTDSHDTSYNFGGVSISREQAESMTLAELAAYYEEHESRGEFVILIAGKDKEDQEAERRLAYENLTIEEHMARYADLPEKEAMKAVARDRGISKRDVYAALKK